MKLEYENMPGTTKETIKPMIEVVPQWYKESQRWLNGVDNGTPGVKQCVPFLDALTTGYYMALAQDLYVEQTPEGPSVRWAGMPAPVNNRPPGQTGRMPAPSGYSLEHTIFQTQAAVKLPDGYSAIFTHPLNRYDLPFITLSGVVDGPFVVHGGNIPFHIKDGFEGVIPKGTPIIQIIPFKRENWESKLKKGVWAEGQSNVHSDDYKEGHWYRRRKWQKKSYR